MYNMTKSRRIIAPILATLLVLSITQFHVVAQPEVQSSLLSPVIIEEVVSRREKFAKHFLCDDGSDIIIAYPRAVHMERDGEWVDATFPLTDEGSRLLSANADISLARSTNTAEQDGLVRFSADGYAMVWSLEAQYGNVEAISQNTEAQVLPAGQRRSTDSDESSTETAQWEVADLLAEKEALLGQLESFSFKELTSEEAQWVAELNEAIEVANRERILDISFEQSVVEYPDALGDGTILRYILSPGQVKEEIVLAESNGFVSYSMLIDTEGLSAALQEDDEILLFNESGEVVFTIAAPYMYDEAGESSCVFTVSIAEEDGRLVITYAPDAAWMNDEGRVWPVVIDPTVDSKSITNANQIDNYVWDGGAGAAADSILWAGNKVVSGVRKSHHIYWRLGVLPSLGSNYTITGASFNIRVYDADSTMGSNGLSLYKANSTWTSGGITWANQPGVTLIDSCGNSMPANPKWKSFSGASVVTTVKGWYSNTSTNHGFSLRYTSTSDTDANRFYSADNGVSYIPYIAVTYTTASVPAAPTNLRVLSFTANTVALYWNASANATGYNIYKDGVFYNSTSTSTSITVQGLNPLTAYNFYVAAKNANGSSPASNTVSQKTHKLLGTLSYWDSDSNNVGRWGSSVSSIPSTIYVYKLNGNASFDFQAGFTNAISEWNSALGSNMSKLETAPPSSAKISFYGGNTTQLTNTGRFGTVTGDVVGLACFPNMVVEGVWKKSTTEYKSAIIPEMWGYVLDAGYTSAQVKCACTHELGHAMGWRGHAAANTNVMHPYMTSIYTLTTIDKRNIQQLY